MNKNFKKKCCEIFEKQNHQRLKKSDIKAYENETGIKLSVEMRYVIKNYEGVLIKENYGFIGKEKSPFADENGYESIMSFLGFNEKDNLSSEIGTYNGQLPEGYLPIAHVDGGNLICIDRLGKIYTWLHDEGEGSNLFLANNDFESFIFSIEKISKAQIDIDLSKVKLNLSPQLWASLKNASDE